MDCEPGSKGDDMTTTLKGRLGWMVLALLLVLTSLSAPPARGDSQCPLEACADQCNETCQPYGGTPATCQWRAFAGRCVGICWCYSG